ncbi:aspartyl-phosphate phosphatase Spo0E family protein [Paenibacillus sp. UNC499MF]|uniref:aspartyl-phosphate phosphatase Spo0E family protein n=1 Tax=Paenibacillus sp. UNC499MF TaxID=1502751 RepID=UPI0008A06EEA|nr:aspartyl-phosphate phosphatase Spo0E family protein [Paenibacillus sp. UNC499MF]SEF89371.1 Spo0E like sporulation regulatory protein [Paenibacillus sp. UNC499MF]
MAYLEYRLADNSGWFSHDVTDQRWLSKRPAKLASLFHLEEEIQFMRNRLEQMVQSGEAMTSESVIEMSMLLDHKINEYMNLVQKSR